MTKKNSFCLLAMLLAVLTTLLLAGCSATEPADDYDAQLADLQRHYKTFHAGAPRFFLFGMGNRSKFVYKDFQLISIDGDSVMLRVPDATGDSIMPADYRVTIDTRHGARITIEEDEQGIWLTEGATRRAVAGTDCPLHLPDFREFRYGRVLRVLHHELLFNVRDARIYPNVLAYREPFYRDAFMAALCLELTGNTHLLAPWLCRIDSIYDMQNGEPEPDNIGELLYMLSLVPRDSNQSLRQALVAEAGRLTVQREGHRYIKGHTDGADNAQYQTQILKLALQKSQLEDRYTDVPADDAGDYADLCWFTKGGGHRRSLMQHYRNFRFNFKDSPFPYLQWARAHYYDDAQAPFNHQRYPLSWEKRGGSAHFEGMRIVSEEAASNRICYPHAWTAAEMFLKLYE